MKNTATKSKNKYIIAINLFLIAMLAVVTVYAWFASREDNHVDAYDIEVVADEMLELSFDQTNWNSTLNLSDCKIGGKPILETVQFTDITGDGSTFLIPELEQKINYAYAKNDGAWKNAVANKDYLDFTVYMRSKDKVKVYLSSRSNATRASTTLTGENCENKSDYAQGVNSFSKDCIVGALRVAVFDSSDSKKFIWITNPEFHLDNKVGSDVYKMDVNATKGKYTDGTGKPSEDFSWNDPYTHYYQNRSNAEKYTGSVIAGALPAVSSGTTEAELTNLATLGGTSDDGYYYSKASFRLWLEGCDTEARRALVNGKFNLSLIFDSISAQ